MIESSPYKFEIQGLKAISYQVIYPETNLTKALVSNPFYFKMKFLDYYGNIARKP